MAIVKLLCYWSERQWIHSHKVRMYHKLYLKMARVMYVSLLASSPGDQNDEDSHDEDSHHDGKHHYGLILTRGFRGLCPSIFFLIFGA